MAKKKKNNYLSTIIYASAVLLGIVAISMMFTTVAIADKALGFGLDTSDGLTGLQIAFGYSNNDKAVLNFSFVAFLPYLLILLATATIIYKLVTESKNNLVDYLAVLLFIAGAVVAIFVPSSIVFADTIGGTALSLVEFKLSFSGVLTIITSALAGSAVMAKNFI